MSAVLPTKYRNVFSKIHFRALTIARNLISVPLRICYLRLLGAHIGARTNFSRAIITWPHQLWIGDDCDLENDVRFHHTGCLKQGPNIVIGNRNFFGHRCEFTIMSRIEIGNDCQFAAGCRFIDVNHEIDRSVPINLQSCAGRQIKIHDDVWFGANVIVLPGVTVGKGAVVGAGAVITKDIPPYEIWAGTPARKIGERKNKLSHSEQPYPRENVLLER